MVGVVESGYPDPVDCTPSAVPRRRKFRFGKVPLRADAKCRSLTG
jgi:hypothetical protein